MNHDIEKKLRCLSDEKANLILLILTSQNIKTRVKKENNLFNIFIDPHDMEKALFMIETYYRENKFFRLKQQLQEICLSSFKSYTAIVIMGILWLIHATCIHYHVLESMILKYGASSLFIIQGETFRAITALFLHSDARHLAGNMAGLLIFGAPLINLAGFGAGSFMLLLTGTLGNLFNACLYKTAHLSIGASTAVMGAAGLLAAFQITKSKNSFHLNQLMPIFAGAVLMAMFSQGENTDIWAHVFGFLSGIFTGIVLFPLNRMLDFPQKDLVALFVTLFIIASSIIAGA